MFVRKKINDYKISVPRNTNKTIPWKGSDCLDTQFFVMSILGKRRTGKSTLIYTLLKYFATRKTIVIFFCPTFWKDNTYKSIRTYLDSKDIVYTDFQEVNNNGINNVEILMKQFEEKVEGPAQYTPERVGELIEEEKKSKKSGCKFKEETGKKTKKIDPPEYIIIFDDISNEIRDKSIIKLCKNSRHYKSKIILSTQSVTDLHPHQFAQLDYLAIFKDYNNEQVKQIYERIQPNLPFDEFLMLYKAVTADKPVTTDKRKKRVHNSFLFVDRANQKYRENLDCVIDRK